MRSFIYQISGFVLALSTLPLSLSGQTPIEDEIFIWTGIAPGSDTVTVVEDIEDRDPDGEPCYLDRVVKKVTQPSIKLFAPANP
ncbi:MAG: hypothetical protein KDC44_21680, partial [Phaeodactylibacter sp.]|nr:hypothetical protein [Phaeodactylibacter sp.]